MITQSELKELLEYRPDTGQFVWRVSRQKIRVGDIAGSELPRGYRQIMLNGKKYLAHRLVWLYVHGKWPEYTVDHIDRNPSNNCIENLRDVPQSVNNLNSSADPSKRRNNVRFELSGICRTVSEWARAFGQKPATVFNRLRRGWSIQRALTEHAFSRPTFQ